MVNKVVIVTGAARGIGRAVATRLAGDGWSVVAVDREPEIHEVVDGLPGDGSSIVVEGDLIDPGTCERIVATAAEHFGRIDGLVNNAGITWPATIEATGVEDWDRVQAVNLRAPFLLLKASIPHMEAGDGGSIVNISSFHAHATLERFAAYAASKAGVIGMTRSTALELGPRGIRVNAVCPGVTETAMWEAWLATEPDPDASRLEANARQPTGRTGKPHEIAAAVAFLLSPDASYMTGSTVTVDGGVSARLHHP